MVINLMKAD